MSDSNKAGMSRTTRKAKAETYIDLAKEDLVVAGKLKNEHPRHCAFNIEQAAQKLLKAVLTAEDLVFPASHHQLGSLAELLTPDHTWRADLMTFDQFTSYATRVRYPTPGGKMPAAPERDEPERDELQEGMDAVNLLVDEIEDWCRERLDPAPKSGG